MLWPNRASGLSSRCRSAAKIWSANSGTLSILGSWSRVCRPGCWRASTSTDGCSALDTGKKKLAEPPAYGRHASRTLLSGAGCETLTHFSNCAVARCMADELLVVGEGIPEA